MTFNENGEAVVSASGDEFATKLHVTVGDGVEPSDPTAASNDGTITGTEGTVDTGVKITTGNEAIIKAVSEDVAGKLGPVSTAKAGRRVGPLHSDASSRAVTGTTSETTMDTITVPADTLATNGVIHLVLLFEWTGISGDKTFRLKWGGTTVVEQTYSNSNVKAWLDFYLYGSASATSQRMVWTLITQGLDGSTSQFDRDSGSEDVTTDTDLEITGQLTSTSSTITLLDSIATLMGTK